MSEYDYGNARLRAMRSRLLTSSQLEALAQTRSLEGLINELARTAYEEAVEAAMVLASPLDCVSETLHQNLMMTLGKTKAFYSGRALELVTAVLRSYDVQNLKTILRGLSRHVTADEISRALFPVGELGAGILVALTQAREPREAIDQLASMRMPIARPLLRLRGEQPGADLLALEMALERWYFDQAFESARRQGSAADVLVSALELGADMTNLLTALRFAHNSGERNGNLAQLLVRAGRVPISMITRVGEQRSVEDAVSLLADSPYGELLARGMVAYTHSGRLSDLERRLYYFRLHFLEGLVARDPLGIGVFLGYSALKTDEVAKIRWIAHGLDLGLRPEEIQKEIELSS